MELVAESMERLGAEISEAERHEYRQHKASVADAQARVDAAAAWMERTGLSRTIPHVVETLRTWHAWIKRDDFGEWVPEDLYDIAAVERRDEKPGYTKPRTTFRVDFRLESGGARYGFEFTEEPGSFDGTTFGEARVYAEDALVLAVPCMKSHDEKTTWEPRWSTRPPNVLVPGVWVAALLDLDHRLRMHSERKRRGDESTLLTEQASRLPDPTALG